jgi:HKD family nuclease
MMVCVAAIVSTVILEMETPVIIYNFNELLTVLISTRICSSLYFLVPFYMTGGILLILESLYSISF